MINLFITYSLSFASPSKEPLFRNIVTNPDFEVFSETGMPPDNLIVDGWQKYEGNGSTLYIEEEGYKSKHSISIKGSGTWKQQISGIRPNRYYLISFRVKQEGWKDGEYPYLKIFDKEMYLNEFFSWGGWRRVSYIVNSGEMKETDLIFISKGLTHKIIFDDISLSEFQIYQLSPSPDEVITVSRPEFRWKLPYDDRVFSIIIEISRDRQFRNRKLFHILSPTGESFKMIDDLEDGEWYWRAFVYYNRKIIALSDTTHFRVSSPQIINKDKGFKEPTLDKGKTQKPLNKERAIEDFFPIAIYGAEIEGFEELKNYGFNTVQNYSTDSSFIEKFISSAESHGLKALIRIPSIDNRDRLDSFVGKMADSKGLLGWYLEDEPEGRGVSPSYLWRWGSYIHSIDRDHPTALVNIRANRVIDYEPAVDIVMVDPYPIPNMPITWISDSVNEARKAVFDEKPVWAVIQAFNWASYLNEYKIDGTGRYPTYEEMRAMSFLSIVHGAKGIFFFSYQDILKDEGNMESVRRVVSDLNMAIPFLFYPVSQRNVSISAAPVFKFVGQGVNLAKFNPPIHFSLREKENEVVLIAVNVTKKPVNIYLDGLPEGLEKIDNLFKKDEISIKNGHLQDSFEPYEVKFYRTK